MKEVDQLKDLARKQGLLGDLAARELAEAARLARDPKVRKAAQDALKDASQKTEEPNLDDVELLKALLKEKGRLADAAARELSRLSKEAKDAGVRDAAGKAFKELAKDLPKNDPVKDAAMKDVAQLKEMLKKEGLLGDMAAQGLAEIARLAKDPTVRKAAAADALKTRADARARPRK